MPQPQTPPVQTGIDDLPLLLTVKFVAEQVGMSSWQVRQLISDGTLPSLKIRERLYIPVQAYRDFKATLGVDEAATS